jgi:DNA processing protein
VEDRYYYLGFSVCPGIGPKRFSQLVKHFGSAKSAWYGGKSELQNIVGKHFSEIFVKFRESFSFEIYIKELKKKDISFLTPLDKIYPSLLKSIPNPPFVLYVKGKLDFSTDRTIGVVGTRKITSYGNTVTEMICKELVDSGFVIVSGLAMGVDAVSHKSAIIHRGKTIAVMGCGVDCCTPAVNQALYNSIVNGSGVVISEFPIGMLPTKGSFPSRNRIIAGLSRAVVVTEGAEDSGSLITASNALEFGRPVFAVPGPITSSLSKGPNKLLSEGAKLVTSAGDILKELGVKNYESRKGLKVVKGETEEEQKIIDLLQNESLHFDEIVKKSAFQPSSVGMILSMMEMKGMITQITGKYSLNH